MSSARPAVAAIVFAALAACGGDTTPAQQAAAVPSQAQVPPPVSSAASTPAPAATVAPPVTAASAATIVPARDYLPLPEVPFAPARPMPVVETVFHFAADHPEILSHIPCFCGCENRGHRDNDDCFVAARDARGRVTAWEPHGMG